MKVGDGSKNRETLKNSLKQPRRRNDDVEIEAREEEQQRWSLIQLNNGDDDDCQEGKKC